MLTNGQPEIQLSLELEAFARLELIPRYLSASETKALKEFGQRFGARAFEQRLWGLLQKRSGKSRHELARDFTDFLSRQDALAMQVEKMIEAGKLKPFKAKKEKKEEDEKQEFVDRFAESSLPLVSSFLALKIWHESLGKHFNQRELDEWERRLQEDGEHARQGLIAEIEERSGKSWDAIKQAASDSVVQTLGELFFKTAQDVYKIDKAGKQEELIEAMAQGDVQTAAEIFQEISNLPNPR